MKHTELEVLVTSFSIYLYIFLSLFFFSFFCSVKEITTPIEHTSETYRKQYTYSLEDSEGNTYQFQNSSIIPQLWILRWLCTLHQNHKGLGPTSARLNTQMVKGESPSRNPAASRGSQNRFLLLAPGTLSDFSGGFCLLAFSNFFLRYSCKALCGNINSFLEKENPRIQGLLN